MKTTDNSRDMYKLLGTPPVHPVGFSSRNRLRRCTMKKRYLFVIAGVAIVSMLAVITTGLVSSYGDEVELGDEFVSWSPARKDNQSLKVILIGDTGGIPIMKSTRTQRKVAAQMAERSRYEGLDAVINTGDNIYFTGAENEHDSRFESSFETPYRSNFLDVPWYMIAGNHDHFGNVTAQVEYSKYSRKWRFPSLYYNVSMQSPDGASVDVVFIDTIVLCGNSRDIEFAGFWKMTFARSHDPEGPTNKTAADLQWTWLKDRLQESKADYLLVVGHYPVHSISSHGPTTCLQNTLNPLLYENNVSAYVSGHDHSLQHITYPSPSNSTKVMNYLVTGAGSRSDPSTKHSETLQDGGTLNYHFPKSGTIFKQLGMGEGGFMYASFNKREADIKFLDNKGIQLYSMALKPRSL